MSSVVPARALLAAQAGVTALSGVLGGLSGWTFVTLLTAAGAVFVAAALQQAPEWRLWAIGFEAGVVALGLAALVSGHVAPGALLAGAVLVWLTGGSAARAFAGPPSFEAVAPQPAAPAPVLPPEPRRPVLDVLPRR